MGKFLTMVLGKSAEVAKYREKFEDLHGRASSAKKQYEGCRDELDAMLAKHREEMEPDRLPFPNDEDDDDSDDDSGGGGGGGDDPKPGPQTPPNGDGVLPEVAELFRRQNPTGGDVIDVEFSEAQPALPAPSVPTSVGSGLDPDAWRNQVIDGLPGLAAGTAAKLAEAGIKTVGNIADWSNSGKKLTDVDGIGESRAAELEEALDDFWARWHHSQAAKPESEKQSRKRKPKSD